jgi:hypothetical protein
MKLYEEVDEQASPDGWIYLEDGEYYNLYSTVEDVSDPTEMQSREIKRLDRAKKSVQHEKEKEGKREIKKKIKEAGKVNPIPNAIQIHGLRVTGGNLREAWNIFGRLCQSSEEVALVQKEIHMNMQERLAVGVENLQKVHDMKGSVTRVNVGHDEGCRVWDGGKCSCSPDITLEVDGVNYMIDDNGDVFKWVLTDS